MTQFYSFTKKYPTTPPDAKAAAEIISLAKSINAGTSGNHASKTSWYEVMKRLADQDRKSDQSSQQAFAAFIQTPDSAYARLKKIASNLREESPDLTDGAAFLKAFTDPANRELAELSKREQVFA
jgi:hypothetical protein